MDPRRLQRWLRSGRRGDHLRTWGLRACGASNLSPKDRSRLDRHVEGARPDWLRLAFGHLLSEGRAMTLERAVAYALGTPGA